MKTQLATTQDQSARLLQCGVSAETADMCYDSGALSLMDYGSAVHERDSRREKYAVAPAWSLSALLGLLPKTIGDFWMTKWFVPNVDGFEIDDMENPYLLSGDFQLLHIGGGNYQVEYDWDGFRGKLPQSDNPIESCVLAIELLTANGYKLNEI